MEQFVRRQNIREYRRQLGLTIDPEKRSVLLRLLKAELMKKPSVPREEGDPE